MGFAIDHRDEIVIGGFVCYRKCKNVIFIVKRNPHYSLIHMEIPLRIIPDGLCD